VIFTHDLHTGLQAGAHARIDGGYGMFDYKSGGSRQVWIAGGIGVTPFLSWVRDFGGSLDFEIDFFYTVRSPDEALFLDEFQAAARRYSSFHLYPVFSTAWAPGRGQNRGCLRSPAGERGLHLRPDRPDRGDDETAGLEGRASQEHPFLKNSISVR